jgi:hypothetical protein
MHMRWPLAVAALALAALPSTEPRTALAATTPASVFDLSGDGLHVTYTSTGPDGQPHLRFTSPTLTLGFTGTEIRTVAAPDLGTLVSVTIRRTVDSGSTSFTLVVPPVVLDSPDATAPVQVLGITTVHPFSVVRRFRLGQLAAYSEVTLTGTARSGVP